MQGGSARTEWWKTPGLRDRRSGQVVFLAHCLLNENTRYLGGACSAGCVPAVVEACLGAGAGVVQLPCPEQQAWGGVLKRRLLWAYGLKQRHPLIYRLRRLLLPLFVLHTRLVYRRLARATAAQIADYQRSGFTVLGIVGVDGSPSCGVASTLDLRDLDGILSQPLAAATVDSQNRWVRQHAASGTGLFIHALQRELRRRGCAVPFVAYDLLAELDGRPATVDLHALRQAARPGAGQHDGAGR